MTDRHADWRVCMCNIVYFTDIANLDPSANLTNGVTAMVITAPDGELLGIRVMWRIKSEYLGCHFTTLRAELQYNCILEVQKLRLAKTSVLLIGRLIKSHVLTITLYPTYMT